MPDDDNPTDELESRILGAWALRFAGDEFAWDEEELLAVSRRGIELLEFPDAPEQRFALLFAFQRYLAKWGGEQLPRFASEWRAYRTLFLLTCWDDMPVRWRASDRYDAWFAFSEGRVSNLIAVVARAHARTVYRGPRSSEAGDTDPLRYYNLEAFLFGDVNWAFSLRGHLTAFEFFSIVIWKANRAKSLIAAKLLSLDPEKRRDLDAIVRSLTAEIAICPSHADRLPLLMTKWRFALPMASAILTVLYPDHFSVYDVRACDELGVDSFRRLANLKWSARLSDGYRAFCDGVAGRNPLLSLRDSDRVLWAQSAIRQLESDISTCFGH